MKTARRRSTTRSASTVGAGACTTTSGRRCPSAATTETTAVRRRSAWRSSLPRRSSASPTLCLSPASSPTASRSSRYDDGDAWRTAAELTHRYDEIPHGAVMIEPSEILSERLPSRRPRWCTRGGRKMDEVYASESKQWRVYISERRRLGPPSKTEMS